MSPPARELPTLRQLDYFAALVEEGSFGRAADRCGISQPSMSAQVARLEALVGLPLIERARSGALPTPAGREVYERALAVLAAAREIAGLSMRIGVGVSGTIRFGASATLGPYLLPHAVAALHRDNPALRLYIREAPPRMLLDDLARGEHDLLLTQLPVAAADVTVIRLFREPLELALARDHPLATHEVVSRADLAGQRLLTLGPAYSLHGQVAGLCETLGARMVRDYEGTSLDAVRLMVGMGMGISFLPALYVRQGIGAGGEDVVIRRLEGPRITRSVGLALRGGQNVIAAAAGEIAATLRELARRRFGDVLRLEEG